MGLAVVLQTHTGLRPGELLAIKPEHVLFPWDVAQDVRSTPVTIALGVKTGTKVKRAQVARLHYIDIDVITLLFEACQHTKSTDRLFPFTAAQYGAELRHLDQLLKFGAGWTPHSGRAGFATDSRQEGRTFEEIREAGRWQADSSLRVYLDVVTATSVLLQARANGLSSALAWAARYWRAYFVDCKW